MSTQYDAIGASYEEMKKLPAAQLEAYNFRKAVALYVKGAKVLDLACRTGFYAKTMLEMGAALVVGVDISSAMISVAKATSQSDKLVFQVGDCSKPMHRDGGHFDVVPGVCLLNYASNGEEMTDMFRNVAMNLREGGRFLAVTPHPANDPKRHSEAAAAARPVQYGNVTVSVTGEVADGVATHLVAVIGSGTVEFDAYHLRKEVYEQSAIEGGMRGTLAWRPIDLRSNDDAETWGSYLKVPHFGILEVYKC